MEKKNLIKFLRDEKVKGFARNIVREVQDDGQGLEQEIEAVHRIGK